MSAAVATSLAEALNVDPPRDIQKRFLEHSDDLVMVPAVAMEALDVAKNPNCSISTFSSVIEKDVKLAADILAMANSALYAPPTPVVSLHQAIIRLGFRQCKNLILTSSIAGLMKRVSLKDQRVRDVLWQHSFTTSLAALQLNRTMNLGFQGEEFTACLVHDLGRTLLAILEPELFTELDPLDFHETFEIVERERSVAGTDHCTLGAWFLKWSGLPDVLSDVIRFHHLPSAAPRDGKLIALTAAADHIANHLQRQGRADEYLPHENLAIDTLSTFVNRKIKSWFSESAHALLEQTAKDASEMIPPLR